MVVALQYTGERTEERGGGGQDGKGRRGERGRGGRGRGC